jgi:hypothetical protein
MKGVNAAIVRNLSREPPPRSAGNLILDVPAYGCRINNRKELHFLFRPRLRGNNDKVSSGLCAGFNGREGDRARTGHCQLFRGPRQGRASGNPRTPSREPQRLQAAASSSLNEPLTSALRPFAVMAGTRSLMVARPSATRSSRARWVEAGSPAKGERMAFNASH